MPPTARSGPVPTADRFAEIRTTRATHPERIGLAHARRRRRALLTDDRLLVVAADHPGRGALAVGGEPDAMADRYDLLDRLIVALGRPGVDGVLATPDVIDDLVLLGALDGKVVVGSMNRGGLAGAAFEMDDRFTGYDMAAIVRDRLDVAKILLRVNLADPGTSATLDAAAAAVTAAAAAGVPIIIEPFMTVSRGGGLANELTPDAVIRSVAIASGLGTSSARTWLKLPVVAEMDRVMRATTLPTLLLGGDPADGSDETYERWSDALALPGVHGLVAGRQLIYPPDGDVVTAVDAAAGLVHGPSTGRTHSRRPRSVDAEGER